LKAEELIMKNLIIKEAKKTASTSNCTFLEIITAMQGQAVKMGNEKLLDVLIEIKRESI